MNSKLNLAIVLAAIIPISRFVTIEVNTTSVQELAKVYSTDFENGADNWKFIDHGWNVKKTESSHVLSQHTKKSDHQPKFRSPFHIALLNNKVVTDFQLDVRVLSTHEDYKHRDACLFFNYQSPTRFYYVHLGKKTDPHANQIFIVNDADRTKISLTTTDGTDWDDQWHNVRVTRNVATGEIQVFFDNMTKPVMTAVDKTFTWGQVGLGSFDDTTDWDDFILKGNVRQQTDLDIGAEK